MMKRQVILLIAFLVLILYVTSTAHAARQPAAAKKKIFISTLQASTVPKKTLAEIRNRIILTIIEENAERYQVITDEDIRALYRQAESIMASGSNGEDGMSRIAEAIDADEVIYGEAVIDSGKISLVLHNIKRKRNGGAVSKKSLVTISFYEQEADYFSAEVARKLVMPSYKIVTREIPVNTAPGRFDIKILNFTTTDNTVNEILPFLKESIQEGDRLFEDKYYDESLAAYERDLDRIEKNLTPDKKRLLRSFVEGIRGRIDACHLMKTAMAEKEGDEAFLRYDFPVSMGHYQSARNFAGKIINSAMKNRQEYSLGLKIVSARKTGENFLQNKVRSLMNRAQGENIRGNSTDARDLLSQAKTLVVESAFFRKDIMDEYNITARTIIGAEKELLVLPGSNNIYITMAGAYVRDTAVEVLGPICQYSENASMMLVKSNDKFGLMGSDGRIVLDIMYDEIAPQSEGLSRIRLKDRWGYVNDKGRVHISPWFTGADDFGGGLAAVTTGDTWYYINKYGTRVSNPNLLLIPVQSQGGSWGYCDNSGRIIIRPQFEAARSFSESLAAVCLNGRWGFINRDGYVVASCQYDEVKDFTEERAAVKNDGMWGYINRYGSVAISFQFENAESFTGGKAVVKYMGCPGTAYKNGTFQYWRMSYGY